MVLTNDVKALIEAIENDAGIAWGHVDHLPRKVLGSHWETALNAYLGSLNAAKALHEALLPGWRVRVSQPDHYLPEAPFTVNVWPVDASRIEAVFHPGGTNEDMARAWLLAILRAHAQEAGL